MIVFKSSLRHPFIALAFSVLDAPSFEYTGRMIRCRVSHIGATLDYLARFGMTKVDRRTTAEESQSHEHDADDRWNCQAPLVDDVFLHSSTRSFIDKIADLAPQRLRQLRNVLSGESLPSYDDLLPD